MISVDKAGESIVLKVQTTRFDASNASAFDDAVKPLAGAGGEYTVDLGDVAMIDSTAVAHLLSFYHSLPENARAITITNAQPAVASMIEFLKLHHVFDLRCKRHGD